MIDELRAEKSGLGSLAGSEQLISDYGRGSESNFAYCRYGIGEEGQLVTDTLDSLRRETEACDSLQGFKIMHSVEGGTGSGLFANIVEQIMIEYGKIARNSITLFPSTNPKGDRTLGAYNAVLSIYSFLEWSDNVIVLDNKNLYKKCLRLYDSSDKSKLTAPSYKNLNQLVSSAVANYTSTFRFSTDGESLNTLDRINMSLIPYPRIKFVGIGHTQLSFENKLEPGS